MRAYRIVPACLGVFLTAVSVARASEPDVQLTEQIDAVFKVLSDPGLRAAGQEIERRTAISPAA